MSRQWTSTQFNLISLLARVILSTTPQTLIANLVETIHNKIQMIVSDFPHSNFRLQLNLANVNQALLRTLQTDLSSSSTAFNVQQTTVFHAMAVPVYPAVVLQSTMKPLKTAFAPTVSKWSTQELTAACFPVFSVSNVPQTSTLVQWVPKLRQFGNVRPVPILPWAITQFLYLGAASAMKDG